MQIAQHQILATMHNTQWLIVTLRTNGAELTHRLVQLANTRITRITIASNTPCNTNTRSHARLISPHGITTAQLSACAFVDVTATAIAMTHHHHHTPHWRSCASCSSDLLALIRRECFTGSTVELERVVVAPIRFCIVAKKLSLNTRS